MTGMGSIAGSSDPDYLICPQCGAPILPNVRFCGFCGERFNIQGSEQAETHPVPDIVEVSYIETLPLSVVSAAHGEQAQARTNPGDIEVAIIETLPLSVVSSVHSEQVEAPAPSDEVPIIETLLLPAISQAHTHILQAFRLLQSGGRTGRAQQESSLLPDRETSPSNSAFRGGGSIRHPWLLTRLLLHRARHDSLLRNSIFIMATNGITAFFGYIFWIVAAHAYSTYDVGLGSALLSVLVLASTLALMGMDATLVQELPRRESGRAWSVTINAGLAIGSLAGLLGGIILVVVLPFVSSQFAIVGHQLYYILVLVAGVPLMTVSFLLDQVFIAERAAHNKLIRQLVAAVLKIPLLVLPVLLIHKIGALGILLPWVLAIAVIVVMGLLLLPLLRRGYRLAVRGIVGQIRSMFSLLAGNQFISLGGILPYYLLPVFVAILLSPADNAYYYTTMRLAEFFTMGSYAVSMSLFAEGSHAADDLPRKVRSSVLIISIIIGPAMLFCLFAGHYILLLFGANYAQHGLVLFFILVLSTIPDSITNVYLTVLRVQKRLRFAGLLTLSMGALTLVLTWILLPLWGIAGAGWAFLISQSVGSLVAVVDAIRMSRHRHEINEPAFQSDAGHTETSVSN